MVEIESLVTMIRDRARPADKRRAGRLLALWRKEAGEETRAAYGAIAARADDLDGFLAAVFDGSPFLFDLARRDPARFVRVLARRPQTSLSEVLNQLRQDEDGADDAALMRRLRLAKQEAALLIALCDIAGIWDPMQVTEALTCTAETAMQVALRALLLREAERGRILPQDMSDPSRSCGYFLLGMGKLGARELNFSSDIDLIAFYDRDVVRLKDPDAHQAVFVRLTQQLARLLSEQTYDGLVFRVDLRLRPDPGTYPVAISTVLAESYYEAVGQNWERAAMIKARPVAGDLEAGERFLKGVRPFVYRRYLDYAAIAEVHAMKRQIHAVKGHDAIAVEGHNLKLGRGGIREIEFFVQTQQLIGGGRDPRLRVRETLAALDALVTAGWIDEATRRELHAAYLFLRRLEHRVQMVADEQTHTLPTEAAALGAFAKFAGYASRAALAKELARVLTTVQRHYARLFEAAPGAESHAGRLDFSSAQDQPETLETLATMGFAEPTQVVETVQGWLSGRAPATRTQVARERLGEILPRLLEALATTGQPDTGLVAFDRFVSRLPAGIQVFSLLRSNPQLIDLFATILGTAPRLAKMLSLRPRVLEGVIEQFHAPSLDPLSELDDRLARALEESGGYEDALDRARAFAQEQIFLIGVRVLSGTLPAETAGTAFTRLAGTLVRELHARVAAEHARRHGRTPRGVSAVVALGKFGSSEMTASSDLDLLLLYDDPFDAPSDGAKPLYASEYYTRLTQRLVAALSAPTAQGIVYPVDFRLRPSGNKGPLATSLASFADYQERDAWTWEHMALTRARVISAPPDFATRIEATIDKVLRRPRQVAKLTADIAEMRRMIAKEKPPSDAWDIKTLPGGLVDIEFLAQWLVLRHAHQRPQIAVRGVVRIFEMARDLGVLDQENAAALIAAARLYHALSQIMRLTLDEPFDPATASSGLCALIARAAELPDIARVQLELVESTRRVRDIQRQLWGVALD
jgi:glutamate-ammonia-ligase adenylyltransferase